MIIVFLASHLTRLLLLLFISRTLNSDFVCPSAVLLSLGGMHVEVPSVKVGLNEVVKSRPHAAKCSSKTMKNNKAMQLVVRGMGRPAQLEGPEQNFGAHARRCGSQRGESVSGSRVAAGCVREFRVCSATATRFTTWWTQSSRDCRSRAPKISNKEIHHNHEAVNTGDLESNIKPASNKVTFRTHRTDSPIAKSEFFVPQSTP